MPCVVIQLCNVNQQMRSFQINALIHFLASSTCFEHVCWLSGRATVQAVLYINGEWKSRTNRELEEMSKGENIVKWIKGQRISW